MKIIRPGQKPGLNGPVAVALGCFDGVHKGHAEVIGEALCSGLPTAVATFTRHPAEVLKNRDVSMLMSPALKEKTIERLGVDLLCYIDFEDVMELSGEAFLRGEILSRLGAKVVVCGFNYRFGRGREAGPEELYDICARFGARGVCTRSVCDGGVPVSSTRIRGLVARGEMPAAERLLGRPFELYFKVVHGRHLGRTLGTPTINQIFPPQHIVPRHGVYASLTDVGGELLPSVTNVGVKPTVGSDAVSAETYILGYEGDLYGQTVGVSLLEFLRPEERFSSIEALRAQILLDAQRAGLMAGRREGVSNAPD